MKCEVAVAGSWRDVKSEVRRGLAITAEGAMRVALSFTLRLKTGSGAREANISIHVQVVLTK